MVFGFKKKKKVCDLCKTRTATESLTVNYIRSYVCSSCYFAYDDNQHEGQRQRNFVNENTVSDFKKHRFRLDSYKKELSFIINSNEGRYNKKPKNPSSFLKKYLQCKSCNNYVLKDQHLTFFYSKEYICLDCWRNFIDAVTVSKQHEHGIDLFCSYCKTQFDDYEEYYRHHFYPSHMD